MCKAFESCEPAHDLDRLNVHVNNQCVAYPSGRMRRRVSPDLERGKGKLYFSQAIK